MTTQEKIQSFVDNTDYKTEQKGKKTTVHFHEGNGCNFRVIWNLSNRTTKVTKYFTNGYQNHDDGYIVKNGIFLFQDHDDADYFYHTN